MKNPVKLLFASATASLLFACNNSTTKNNSSNDSNTVSQVEELKLENRPLVNDPNAEKLPLFFNLVSEVSTDSTKIYTAKSLYESDTVGMQIEVHNKIPAGVTADGQPDQENGFVEGAIKFSSIGAQSDKLVQVLERLYKVEGTGKMTSTPIAPLVFSSNNKAIDLSTSTQGTYSFKLFIKNPKGEEAEVFAILDNYRKSFEITEKDPSFRAQLLSAFEAQ